jgi:hypothetical protein
VAATRAPMAPPMVRMMVLMPVASPVRWASTALTTMLTSAENARPTAMPSMPAPTEIVHATPWAAATSAYPATPIAHATTTSACRRESGAIRGSPSKANGPDHTRPPGRRYPRWMSEREPIRRLLAACPRLEAEWQGQRVDDDDGPLPYMQAGALARVVVASLGRGDTEGFDALFAEVERILAFGSGADKELVVVGFLEDLQGALGWAGAEPDALRPWLGGVAGREWDGLTRFWAEVQARKASGELPRDSATAEPDDPALRRIRRGLHRPPG